MTGQVAYVWSDSGTVQAFITVLRLAHNLTYFWNSPFNMFGPWLFTNNKVWETHPCIRGALLNICLNSGDEKLVTGAPIKKHYLPVGKWEMIPHDNLGGRSLSRLVPLAARLWCVR